MWRSIFNKGILSTSTMSTSVPKTGWLQWMQHLLARLVFKNDRRRQTQITYSAPMVQFRWTFNFASYFCYLDLQQKFMKFTDNTANVSQSHDAPPRSVSKWFLLSEVRKELSGTRGQSRYHYYGLAVKETSPYYDPGITWKIAKDLTKKDPDENISIQPTRERRPQSTPGGPFSIMECFLNFKVTHFDVVQCI